MPTDASGVHTLPAGYLAVTGETVQASQHNPPLEDLSASVTLRLPRNGAAPMSGPLKLADGAVGAPGLTFNSATGHGLYITADGIGVSVAGAKVAEFTAGGLSIGGIPVGMGVDFWGSTAPVGWLFPYGQSLLRADYPDLFDVIGTTYGNVDETHFTMPNKSGKASFAREGLGGQATTNTLEVSTTITTTNGSATTTVGSASHLCIGMHALASTIPAGVTIATISGTTVTLSSGTSVTAGTGTAVRFSMFADAQVLGSVGGASDGAVAQANLPNVTLATAIASGQGSHTHTATTTALTTGGAAGALGNSGGTAGAVTVAAATLPSMVGTTPTGGLDVPLSKLPPGIVCNYIIFAGA